MRISHIYANLGRRQLVKKLGLDLAAGRVYTAIFVYARESSELFNTALYLDGKHNLAAVIMRFWTFNKLGISPLVNGHPIYAKWNGTCTDLLHQISERKDNFGHIALRQVVEENFKGTPLDLKTALAWGGFPEVDDFLNQVTLQGKIRRSKKKKYNPYEDVNQPLLPWPIKE